MRMSIHSHFSRMLLSSISAARVTPTDRRQRILDAAEACFVRNGFHRSTMNDVAAEAGMSAGNLYRYFASKEAIVTGLTERDRATLNADFRAVAHSPDVFGAIEAIGRKHLVEEPREKAVLVVEIWAEACRNPHIATLCGSIDNEIRRHLSQMLEGARQGGSIAADSDVEGAMQMLFTLADGLMKRRALELDFDGERAIAHVSTLLRSLLQIRDPLPASHSVSNP